MGKDFAWPQDDAVGDLSEGDFQFGALERAQAAVDRLKDVYVAEWAPAALGEMQDALGELRRQGGDRRGGFEALYRLAHDMKGQGGTFGYPLLTHLGEAICLLTADRTDAGEGEWTVLAAHLEAVRHVILGRLEGDGGAAGDRLLRDLRALTRQHMH